MQFKILVNKKLVARKSRIRNDGYPRRCSSLFIKQSLSYVFSII